MYLDSIIYDHLTSDSTLTSQLDDHTDGSPAIFNDPLIPTDFNGQRCINFYNNQPIDGTKQIYVEYFNFNCRAEDKKKSQAIAKTLHGILNRIWLNSESFGHSDILPTINPEDETDVYNTPVQVKIINREGI